MNLLKSTCRTPNIGYDGGANIAEMSILMLPCFSSFAGVSELMNSQVLDGLHISSAVLLSAISYHFLGVSQNNIFYPFHNLYMKSASFWNQNQ